MGNVSGGALLRAWRAHKCLTQQQLAIRIGGRVDNAKISHLEAGRKRPGLELAFAIERATEGGVPAETWLDADADAQQAA
jgi:transcriptional regulator with XRE-family HTH domain